MASNTDPSIYRDRSTIGSSDELDEYGVWVKSEPQDLTGDVKAEVPLAEPSLPDIEDLPDLELDSNELMGPPVVDIPLDTAEAFGIPESEPFAHESPIQEFSDLELEPLATEAFSIEEPQTPKFEEESIDVSSFIDIEEAPESRSEAAPPAKETPSDEFAELSMDDFLGDSSFSGEAIPATAVEEPTEEESDLDIDLTFQDHQESVQEESPEIVDFDFSIADESAAVEVKDTATEAPIETVSDFDDFLNELSDSDAPVASSQPVAPVAPENPLEAIEDIHLDVEESEGMDNAFTALGSSDDDSSIDLNVSLEDETEMPINLSSSEEKAEALFEGAEVISQELEEGLSKQTPVAESKVESDSTLSTQLLLKIADELSSIKGELSSLKEELSVLRSEAKIEQPSKPVEANNASHGFFDEEDDEKIALTGDELDNILNTADFTEEAGADAGEDVSEDLDLGFIEEGISIQTGSEDLALSARPDVLVDSESAIERIDLPLAETEEPEALKQLREEGVQPMTPPPEDTSYLENEELSIEDIDLSEAVIEEPDLGGMILEENTVEEPSIESIDLDEMPLHVESLGEEGLPEEESNLELDDISITLDEASEECAEQPLAEESFAEVIPEQFVVEADATENALPSVEEMIETIPESEAVQENDLEEIPSGETLPGNLRQEVKAVLSYMDQLLESLPEDKIEEFAQSEYFETYKKLFEELGLS